MDSNMRTLQKGRSLTTRLEALQEAYFHWLVSQVREQGHTTRTYWDVLRLMHEKEFVWLVPNDDNRIIDGTDLRLEFLEEVGNYDRYTRDDFGPCSILEVMIAISRRLAFSAGGEPEGWAWQLLDNLKLRNASDPLSSRKAKTANNKLEALIWRTYQEDGTGGFFPLNWPPEDQTKVEIWYQMAAYINEIHPED
jgi:hypothetical protein